MDDFEKKELEGEELTTTEATPEEDLPEEQEETTEPDALYKELEEIRDMFQEAIDNAALEDADDGQLIQELDYDDESAEEAEEEDIDLPICECCGEAKVSTLHGEGYPYCEGCRDLMKHYPLRISGVIAIIAMIAIFALSAYLGGDSLEKALVVLEARSLASENKMMSVVQTLYGYAEDDSNDSKKLTELLVDGFMRTGYINNAKQVLEAQLSKDEIEGNKKYKKLVDFVDNFIATRDAIQDLVNEPFAGKDFDCDKLIAELDKQKEAFLDEEKEIKYNAPIIEYYKYELLRLSEADLAKQLEILRGIEKEDSDKLAEWIYIPSICEVAAKMGNKELAEEYFEKMRERNAEDMKAYSNLALYYRYLETPDADSIIALCEEAAASAPSGDTSYYPTLAIAYLIKGEGALAFDTMSQYMSSNYYTVPNCNLFALLALYCGDTDTYDNMEATLKNSGFEMSELVVKYKKGKLTVEQVIADMRGDIG